MKATHSKKVLIALDNDSTAQTVAEAGLSLANSIGAQIILLNVISDLVSYSLMEYSPVLGYTGSPDALQLQQNSAEGVAKESQDFLNDLKKHLRDKTIQTIVREGDYADSILKAAKDLQVDFIVMGSQSRKWIEKIIMGSTTEKVLYHTSIPLFIVPTIKKKKSETEVLKVGF